MAISKNEITGNIGLGSTSPGYTRGGVSSGGMPSTTSNVIGQAITSASKAIMPLVEQYAKNQNLEKISSGVLELRKLYNDAVAQGKTRPELRKIISAWTTDKIENQGLTSTDVYSITTEFNKTKEKVVSRNIGGKVINFDEKGNLIGTSNKGIENSKNVATRTVTKAAMANVQSSIKFFPDTSRQLGDIVALQAGGNPKEAAAKVKDGDEELQKLGNSAQKIMGSLGEFTNAIHHIIVSDPYEDIANMADATAKLDENLALLRDKIYDIDPFQIYNSGKNIVDPTKLLTADKIAMLQRTISQEINNLITPDVLKNLPPEAIKTINSDLATRMQGIQSLSTFLNSNAPMVKVKNAMKFHENKVVYGHFLKAQNSFRKLEKINPKIAQQLLLSGHFNFSGVMQQLNIMAQENPDLARQSLSNYSNTMEALSREKNHPTSQVLNRFFTKPLDKNIIRKMVINKLTTKDDTVTFIDSLRNVLKLFRPTPTVTKGMHKNMESIISVFIEAVEEDIVEAGKKGATKAIEGLKETRHDIEEFRTSYNNMVEQQAKWLYEGRISSSGPFIPNLIPTN